jgi:CMP-N-acetylneuraminic acid synthetase/spore coat polysaccharide biosynthesis predicted glycosyltransferase SpsG
MADPNAEQSREGAGTRWILVPARAGSKAIPGKNTRPLAGTPLIRHALETAARVLPPSHVIVSTDSVACAAASEGLATVMDRPAHLAEDAATLDEVAVDVAHRLLANGAAPTDTLLTVQPTSPFIRPASLREAFQSLEGGAGSVISVRDERHLRWKIGPDGPEPLFEKRVNRQWLPAEYAETGGIIGSTLGAIVEKGTRVVEPVQLVVLSEEESLDIDTFADWAVAEYQAGRRSIVVRADGSPRLGMGHVYRALALRSALADHDITLVSRTDGEYALGADFLEAAGARVRRIESEEGFFEALAHVQPDITVLDVLDTDEPFVRRVREHAGFVVSIEDLGLGGRLADIIINDLYTDPYPLANHWYGVEYSILGPQFEELPPSPEPGDTVSSILVTFGGTDPADLTTRALKALQSLGFSGHVAVVLGPGYAHGPVDLAHYGLTGEVHSAVTNLAVLMHDADLAITSAGRTVTELMTQGVPTIALCQNERELMHTHASAPFGVVNLGLGTHVDVETVARHIDLMSAPGLRASMRERMLKAVRHRSNRRIADMILAAYETSKKG